MDVAQKGNLGAVNNVINFKNMARNLKPKWKQCRRLNYSLFGSEKWKKRPTLPGDHPISRGRPSQYAVQLAEKQKVKKMYGLLERQFRKVFQRASQSGENTGVKLLQLLELRLDNVVYRLGLAPSRPAARQLVAHGHISVNKKKVDIPSYTVSVGDSVEVRERSQSKEFVKVNIESTKKDKVPAWLNKLKWGGEIKSDPSRDSIDPGVKEQLIVEFYSK